ncbi:MAG TPA: class I SAM-dependent methyltransferase, partial [Planctomycetota bacterium]|nr:class I SAM-dependent methyltransferase [Planctomycetota bacterium]
MPKPSRRAALTARSADRHALYEAAVQDPERDVRLLERIHARVAKRPLRVFREDFCGTAALSATFVRRGEGRRAIGVDLDASTLAWGRRAHLAPLPPETRARVSLVRADVRAPSRVRADLTAAFNFSWQVFRAREDLHAYFRSAL